MQGSPQLDLSKLNYAQPVMASDGNVVSINDNGIPTLLFLQFRSQSGTHIEADVVSAIRFHNVGELKDLQRAISETIEKHETKEP